MMFSKGKSARIIALITFFAVLSNTSLAATWYVDTNADTDPGTCVANEAVNNDNCTFRDAVTQLGNGDTIRFLEDETITDTSGIANAHTIVNNDVTIDGATGGHTIDFDGNNNGGGSALSYLRVFGTGFTLNGVHIYNFVGNGVTLMGGANNAYIHDNVIGQNSAGGGTGNMYGINNGGASGVRVENNVISSNSQAGIFINSLQPVDMSIKGNRLGVDGFLTPGVNTLDDDNGGILDNGNNGSGIEIQGGDFTGGSGLQIGGSLAADRNIISGNGGPALWVRNQNAVTGDVNIENNYIGVGKNGSTLLPNDTGLGTFGAIDTENGAGPAVNWTIKNNVISGNTGGMGPIPGVAIRSGATSVIQGNKIGVKADGTTAAGNSGSGILVDTGTAIIGTNYDGANDAAEANIISNNAENGVENTGAETNSITIAGNRIGLDSAGGNDGNTLNGIKINSNATTINIGKVAPVAADGLNMIGNNGANGIDLLGTGGNLGAPATVTIVNNRIGTDDTANFSNTGSGIKMEATSGVSNVTIGSNGDALNDASERNIIGRNATGGISATEGEIALISLVKNLVVAGNIILGNTPANGSHGILINDAVDEVVNSVVIGGDDCSTNAHATANDSRERNYITDINGEAIYALDMGTANPTTTNLTIQCNQLGIKENTADRPNGLKGISVVDAGAIVIKDNTVGNSTSYAVDISGGTSLGFYGNKIGTDPTGLVTAPNALGLMVHSTNMAATMLTPIPVIIGGATADLANVFASVTGGYTAVALEGLAAIDTPVRFQGNYVGVCADPFGKGTINNLNLAACKSASNGVTIISGAVTIGGANNIDADGTLGEGNVISNTDGDGVYFNNGVGSSLVLKGNLIGLIKATIDSAYEVAAGNVLAGVTITSGAGDVTIGGTGGANASSYRNVIAASPKAIEVTALNASVIGIINNYFNTDWAGSTRIGGTNGIYLDAGTTVNIGGVAANEGNLFASSAAGNAVQTANGFAGTLTLLQNIFGLNAAADTVIAGNGTHLQVESPGATINVGDGTANGRNILSGGTLYAILVQSATAVNLLNNYIGVLGNGTTSAPNATNPAGIIGFGFPVAETYFTGISGGLSVIGNVVNNFTDAGLYFKDVVPTNDATMTADNTYYRKNNTLAPTYNGWQRYVGAVLTAYGPHVCENSYDDDADGLRDLADPGCSSASDTDETDPVVVNNNNGGGGGGGGASPAPARVATPAPAPVPALETAPVPTTTPEVDVQAEADAKAAQDARNFIIAAKLNEAVNPVSDAIAGKDEVSVDILAALLADELSPDKAEKPAEEPVKTPEQQAVQDSLVKLSQGEELSAGDKQKVEVAVQDLVQKAVDNLYAKVDSGAVSAPEVSVQLSNGSTKKITKNTKFEFSLDAKDAEKKQAEADANGEDKVVLTSFMVLGDNNVSALLTSLQNGKIGDPLAAEKIFFKGIEGLSDESDEVDDLKPKTPKVTNLAEKSAPKFLMWLAGPKPGEEVSVFAIKKVDPKDPKTWIQIKLGKYVLDEFNKTAVEIDLTEQMDDDVSNFTIVVQGADGKGSATEVSLDKGLEMEFDQVKIKDGQKVISADLTSDHSGFGKFARNTVNLAAAAVNGEEPKDVSGSKDFTLSGYAEPGTVIFVTWKSVTRTSSVISDSNGYFEVKTPKELENGDHTAYTYSYNLKKKTASNFSKVLFSKFF